MKVPALPGEKSTFRLALRSAVSVKGMGERCPENARPVTLHSIMSNSPCSDLLVIATGRTARVCPITTQDITPYGNGIDHINSIMQPCTQTNAPVVGVAMTTETAVPGCATGASHPTDIEEAARFCVEVAKAYGKGLCSFYDEEEWGRILHRYGPLKLLQTPGNPPEG